MFRRVGVEEGVIKVNQDIALNARERRHYNKEVSDSKQTGSRCTWDGPGPCELKLLQN